LSSGIVRETWKDRGRYNRRRFNRSQIHKLIVVVNADRFNNSNGSNGNKHPTRKRQGVVGALRFSNSRESSANKHLTRRQIGEVVMVRLNNNKELSVNSPRLRQLQTVEALAKEKARNHKAAP